MTNRVDYEQIAAQLREGHERMMAALAEMTAGIESLRAAFADPGPLNEAMRDIVETYRLCGCPHGRNLRGLMIHLRGAFGRRHSRSSILSWVRRAGCVTPSGGLTFR